MSILPESQALGSTSSADGPNARGPPAAVVSPGTWASCFGVLFRVARVLLTLLLFPVQTPSGSFVSSSKSRGSDRVTLRLCCSWWQRVAGAGGGGWRVFFLSLCIALLEKRFYANSSTTVVSAFSICMLLVLSYSSSIHLVRSGIFTPERGCTMMAMWDGGACPILNKPWAVDQSGAPAE